MSGTIVPTLRFADADAAVAMLIDGFGFTEKVVMRDPGGRVEHAELMHGSGMVMVSPQPTAEQIATGDRPVMDLGNASIYVILNSDAEVDAHATNAVAHGATLMYEPRSPSYGGREYTARDQWGHYWSFGTYNPWVQPTG